MKLIPWHKIYPEDEEEKCPECKEYCYPKISKSLEDTDADGNRSRWMTTTDCPLCGHQESYYD